MLVPILKIRKLAELVSNNLLPRKDDGSLWHPLLQPVPLHPLSGEVVRGPLFDWSPKKHEHICGHEAPELKQLEKRAGCHCCEPRGCHVAGVGARVGCLQ